MRMLVAFALAAGVLAGCGGDEPAQPAATPVASVPRSAAPTATAAPAPPAGRPLRFRAADGVRLEGRFVPAGRRAPGIVLSHEVNGGPDQFAGLIGPLHDAGYATLAYRSRDGGGFDETLLARDVVGAVRALRGRREVDPRRIALIGASIGGSAATWTVATRPDVRVRAAVGLSAVEGPAMIERGTAGRFRPHDLLLITDRRERTNTENISDDAGGRGVTGWVAPEAGHGVALIPDPRVRARILDWLRPRLR